MTSPLREIRRGRSRISRILSMVAMLLLGLTVATWMAGSSAKTSLLRQNPAPGELVDVGGYKMHIRCVGQGSPTVILVAGLDDWEIMWSLVQAPVARFTRVCSYDRAGLGWSDPSPFPRTSTAIIAELHTLLVNAHVAGPYVMVGHSFGGALVQLYAEDYPEQVAGLVLVDAAPVDLFQRIPVWRNLIEGKVEMFRTLASLSSLGLLALVPASIPNRGLPDDVLAQYRALASSTRYFETGVAENEMFERDLAEIRAVHITSIGGLPLIVLSRGVWDPLPGIPDSVNEQAWQTWQSMQSELVGLSADAKQVIARQSGHSIQLQQPDLVVDAIRQMVEEIDQ